MITTTASPKSQKPLTIDDVMKAVATIRKAERDSPWILISPDGSMYKGRPEDLIPMLVPYHPLMTIR